MKFLLLNTLTTLGFLLLVYTLEPPLMTESVQEPMTAVILTLAVLTPILEWWLRPGRTGRHGSQVRKIMLTTLIKMMLMLVVILVYLLKGGPDPVVFGMASYLVYLAFTGILVAEAMRHVQPPQDPS